ncbi:hypothetical protein ANN_00262 [Periplaneta americana]|uniref:Uncharacterized protein n=1 Tax=Periplaneta americana TaxID=6978 RepID=A0ABQ8TQA1_PERAM|nr:hypothetical protein ANN_00262 [Periplaneta americana]
MKMNLKREDRKMNKQQDITYVTSKGAIVEGKFLHPLPLLPEGMFPIVEGKFLQPLPLLPEGMFPIVEGKFLHPLPLLPEGMFPIVEGKFLHPLPLLPEGMFPIVEGKFLHPLPLLPEGMFPIVEGKFLHPLPLLPEGMFPIVEGKFLHPLPLLPEGMFPIVEGKFLHPLPLLPEGMFPIVEVGLTTSSKRAMLDWEKTPMNMILKFYPIRGHSFLPCDRAFGTLKRGKNKIDHIYNIEQITEIIEKSSSKFEVKRVKANDVVNFKDWWRKFYKLSSMSDSSYGRGVSKDKKNYKRSGDSKDRSKSTEYSSQHGK